MRDPEHSLTRVTLRNYKSIAASDLEVGPLAILVGPNGAGKSNFLDALRLVAEALRGSLAGVVQERGGFRQIRYGGTTVARKVRVLLKFRLSIGDGFYGFVLERRGDGYVVAREVCEIETEGEAWEFSVAEGEVDIGPPARPPADASELYLARMGRIAPFDAVFEHLSGMAFCNPVADRIRGLQAPDDGRLLDRDGSNLASVLRRLDAAAPQMKEAVDGYLHAMVPQLVSVEPRQLGPMLTLQFQQVAPAGHGDRNRKPRRFFAQSMSDGTLRGLAVLLALLQSAGDGRASLVGIEEPELVLHPRALAAVMDAIVEASASTQTFVTTHSVELLDHDELPHRSVFPVELIGGESRIDSLDDACVAAIEAGDFTVGELLKMGQAAPRLSSPKRRVVFPPRPRAA